MLRHAFNLLRFSSSAWASLHANTKTVRFGLSRIMRLDSRSAQWHLYWSKVFRVKEWASTQSASKCKLFAAWWVIYLKRTPFFFILAWTVFFVISTGAHMTRIAVVSVSVAEPESDWATEATFEVNILVSMLVTIFYTCSNRFCRTFWAHKLFRFKVLRSILIAVLHASKVRILTFETLVVR